ncbi:MAG: Crp/Fnr family transcriptional regulator [Saprospiraceae bacterium]
MKNQNAVATETSLPSVEAAREIMADYMKSNFEMVSMEDARMLSGFSQIKTFAQGDFLMKEGQIQKGCFFVIQGCVREYYLIDGEEKTTAFYTDMQTVTSVASSKPKSPVKFYLECLEATVATFLSIEAEMEMYRQFPWAESLCRVSAEEIISEYQNTLATYMLSTPEERYLNLLETRPELLNRVPQYQLASYLGVKPESLSRIRRRISMKGNLPPASLAEHPGQSLKSALSSR